MRYPGLLLLLISLVGCSTLSTKQRLSMLDSALFQYSEAIRWSDFSAAEKMRRADARTTVTTPPPATPIRVTACNTAQVVTSNEDSEAAVTMTISYYTDDGLMLKTVNDQQHWVYDADAGSWFITSPLPAFMK